MSEFDLNYQLGLLHAPQPKDRYLNLQMKFKRAKTELD